MTSSRQPPSDAALPHLGELTDADSRLSVAVGELASVGGESRPELRHVRYRPGVDCTASWEVRDRDGSRLVSARLFPGDRAARIARRAEFLELSARAGLPGESHRHLDDRHALLQRAPLDYRLPGLVDAMSARWCDEQLESVVDGPGEIVTVEPLVDSYKPWVRSVLCARGPDLEPAAFVKVGRVGDPAPPVDVQVELWARLQAIDAPWKIVRPLIHQADSAVTIVEATKGVSLDRHLHLRSGASAGITDLAESCRRAASGLATLQSCGVGATTTVTPRSMIDGLIGRCERIARVDDELAQRFGSAVQRLAQRAASLPPEDLVLAHGAFRIEHVIESHGDMVVVDLDNLRVSGRSADAGSFLGHLEHMVSVDPFCRFAATVAAEGFTNGLAINTGSDLRWIGWYQIEAQLKWGLRSFFSLVPGWRDVCRRSLDSIERALEVSPMEALVSS